MSAPMVRAILEGRKGQTRRIVTPQYQVTSGETWTSIKTKGWMYQSKIENCDGLLRVCPYGEPGDVLWVRETWRIAHVNHKLKSGDFFVLQFRDYSTKKIDPEFLRDKFYGKPYEIGAIGDAYSKWKPSIFMPKEACRIKLKATDVRVERLNDISKEDAMAEGIERAGYGYKSYEIIHAGRHKGEPNPHSVIPNNSPITSYMELWESINGLGAWDKNPWVWKISFKRIQQ